MMSPSIRDRLSDAQWLAHRYDPGHDAFHFRQVPRSRHAAIPFLTDEYLGEDAPLVLRRTDAIGQAPPAAPIHFVFHSAYCCSTLLAAAFDIPGVAMGLKEPVLLNDLVGWRHRGGGGAQVARVLDESLRLLARPFTAGEATIVKPSNIVNPLIPAIMAMRPEARALLLHAPLDAYLASIARKGMWGRLWVRDLFGKLLREGMLASLGIAPDDYLGLTDIQVAAAGWLAQQQQFQLLTERWTVKCWCTDQPQRWPRSPRFLACGWMTMPSRRSSPVRSSCAMQKAARPLHLVSAPPKPVPA